MSLEVCPICHGRGVVQNGFYSTTGNWYWGSTTTGTETCRSCMGKGYIQATVNVNNSSIRELEEIQQRLKRLEELANLASVQSSYSTLKLGRCCANCKYIEEDMVYTSNPPKFKCLLHQTWYEWSKMNLKYCDNWEKKD